MFLEKKEKEREFKVDYEFSDGSILKAEKAYYKARDFTYLNIDNQWFLTNELSYKDNLKYFGAYVLATIIYCNNVGRLTYEQLSKKIGEENLKALVELEEIETFKENEKQFVKVFLGEKTIYNSCIGTITKKINAMGLKKKLDRTPSANDVIQHRKENSPRKINSHTIYTTDEENNTY